MAAGTSYTTTSVLEAGALVQCHDGAPLRLSHALLLGENPRMSLFDEIRNATLAHPHRCGDFDAAARRFDAQIQVLMGLRVRCRWMPSISNDCPAAADRTDFGAPDFGAVD